MSDTFLFRKDEIRNSLIVSALCRGADNSLAPPTSQCILFDGENISVDASLYVYIVLIFLIMMIKRIYEYQNLLSL